eukprot:tig00020943_g16324.t1
MGRKRGGFDEAAWKPVSLNPAMIYGDDEGLGGLLSIEELPETEVAALGELKAEDIAVDADDLGSAIDKKRGAKQQAKKQKKGKRQEEEELEDAVLSDAEPAEQDLEPAGDEDIVEGSGAEDGGSEEGAAEGEGEGEGGAAKPLSRKERRKQQEKERRKEKRKEKIKKKKEERAAAKAAASAEAEAAEAAKPAKPEPHADLDVSAWAAFGLHPLLLRGLRAMGFQRPTPIQSESLPHAVRDWKDLVGAAETGSGKTLAFALPIVHRILQSGALAVDEEMLKDTESLVAAAAEADAAAAGKEKESGPVQALVLSPTRELALQIAREVNSAARYTPVRAVAIVGGMSVQKQERLLAGRPAIVVATPGRLWELMSAGREHLTELHRLRFLVLDEADRMLEHGHFAELAAILRALPPPYPSDGPDARRKEKERRDEEERQIREASPSLAPAHTPSTASASSLIRPIGDPQEEEREARKAAREKAAAERERARRGGKKGKRRGNEKDDEDEEQEADAEEEDEEKEAAAEDEEEEEQEGDEEEDGHEEGDEGEDEEEEGEDEEEEEEEEDDAAEEAGAGVRKGRKKARAEAAEDGEEEEVKVLTSLGAEAEKRSDVKRQTFLFSATLCVPRKFRRRKGEEEEERPRRGGKASDERTATQKQLDELLDKIEFRSQPRIVDLTPLQRVVSGLDQRKVECAKEDKDQYVYYVAQRIGGRTIVFVNAVTAVKRLVNILTLLGVKAWGLHAAMQQRQRLKSLDRFGKEENAVLVATDVAARGLDIPEVRSVVHYQLPRTPETYVHRGGRTARAMRTGTSVALVSADDRPFFASILKFLDRRGLPDLEVEAVYVPALRERLALARRLDVALNRSRKGRVKEAWFKRGAEAAEMDEEARPKDEIEELAEQRAREVKGRELARLRADLDALLARPLVPIGVSRSYFTASSEAVEAVRAAVGSAAVAVAGAGGAGGPREGWGKKRKAAALAAGARAEAARRQKREKPAKRLRRAVTGRKR